MTTMSVEDLRSEIIDTCWMANQAVHRSRDKTREAAASAMKACVAELEHALDLARAAIEVIES